jgi:hypothetical protein
MTFDALAAIEPRLWKLADEIRSLRPRRGYCAMTAWFGREGYKRKLIGVVGWHATPAVGGHPITRTPEAYDCAYRALYGLLVSRGGCGCC